MTLIELYQACQTLLIRGVDPDSDVVVQAGEDQDASLLDEVKMPYHYGRTGDVVINARRSAYVRSTREAEK